MEFLLQVVPVIDTIESISESEFEFEYAECRIFTIIGDLVFLFL
jgi:hypothetical protein